MVVHARVRSSEHSATTPLFHSALGFPRQAMPASASPGHGKRQPGAFQVKSGPSNLQVYVRGAGEPIHVTGGLLLRRSPRQDCLARSRAAATLAAGWSFFEEQRKPSSSTTPGGHRRHRRHCHLTSVVLLMSAGFSPASRRVIRESRPSCWICAKKSSR